MTDPLRIHLICGAPTHDTNYVRLELLKMMHADERAWITVGDSFADTKSIAQSDAIIAYTCNVSPTDPQMDALDAFFARGGRLFALHATNALLSFTDGPPLKVQGIEIPGKVDTTDTNPRFTSLLGSRFLAHLLLGPVAIDVARPDNPIVTGLKGFQVIDEPYIVELIGECEVLLSARFSGSNSAYVLGDWPDETDRPQMYVKSHGAGAVLYLNLGHCSGRYDFRPLMADGPVSKGPWESAEFREVLRRGISWASAATACG
jgi:hypothetical protein